MSEKTSNNTGRAGEAGGSVRRVGPDLAARARSLQDSTADHKTVMETIRNRTRGNMTDPGPMEAALDKAERVKEIWLRLASSAVEDLIASGKEFSADDVRAAMPEGLDPHHPNAWGALFNSYRREGLVELVGYRQSTTKSRNGGVLRMWRGVPEDQAGPADSADPTNQADQADEED